MEREIRRIKRINAVMFLIVTLLLAAIILFCLIRQVQSSFTAEKWLQKPENRMRIVDDLLEQYDLLGMTEEQILELLGTHDNDMGYFQQEDRYVYWMGSERGWISIDSEWLIVDFTDGMVTDYFLTTD